MAAVDELSPEDIKFLEKCEEDLKHRYTDKDEEFMKVFNSEPSIPPIIESWWIPNNRRNNRNNRRTNSYDRPGNRDRKYHDRRDNHNRRVDYERREYNDRGHEDRGYGGYQQSRY